MNPIIFALPGNEILADKLCKLLLAEYGELDLHRFPDKEIKIKINTDVAQREVIIIASLNQPNEKILPLLFLSETARELGAKGVHLIAPYLAYMRQDKRFQPGEGISANYFARLLSHYTDSLLTIDPHLHRYRSLAEIYTIPSHVIHATKAIAKWIKTNVKNPLLIGPDNESQQWVAEIAADVQAPFLILEKLRSGDHEIEINLPEITQYYYHNPILIDDIISTAKTMIETVKQLKKYLKATPICIGVHAIFADNAYQELMATGVSQIITSNTIAHATNFIDIAQDLADAIKSLGLLQ